MVPALYRVRRTRRETYDTFTFELDPPDGSRGFAFAPGQFNMLYAFGVGEVPISISGSPERPKSLIHTVRNVGAVSRALSQAKPGEVVGVRGPFGAGWPVAEAVGGDVVIVAGGLGLSLAWNLPAGPAVVVAAAVLFALAAGLSAVRASA